MFWKKKRTKAEEKQLEMYIQIINGYSTMRAQHEYLFNRIKDLEARVERLEPKEVQKKIDVFAGEGEL